MAVHPTTNHYYRKESVRVQGRSRAESDVDDPSAPVILLANALRAQPPAPLGARVGYYAVLSLSSRAMELLEHLLDLRVLPTPGVRHRRTECIG